MGARLTSMPFRCSTCSIRNTRTETMVTFSRWSGRACPTSTCPRGQVRVRTGRWQVVNWGGAEGSGTRSSLIWCIKEAVRIKRPKYIILENVKNLIGKQFRPYFDHWLELLESYGYKNFYKVINAADCGVPQSRERVFCVSILKAENDNNPQYFFPETHSAHRNHVRPPRPERVGGGEILAQ